LSRPNAVKELEKEVEEMEKKIGNRSEVEPTEAEAELEPEAITADETISDSDLESEIQEALDTQPDPAMEDHLEVDSEIPKKKRENWKKRYTTYKAATDHTLHELRVQLSTEVQRSATLTKQMQALSEKIDKLEIASLDNSEANLDMFSAEERDILGDEAITTINKTTRSLVDKQIGPLKEKIKQQQLDSASALESRAASEREETFRLFKVRLTEFVPNMEEINVNPKFEEWLLKPDTYSGAPRIQLFRSAEASADVGRVAGFFNEFAGTQSTMKDKLDRKITPRSSTTDAVTLAQGSRKPLKVYSMGEVDKFYDDCIRGKYNGKEDLRKKVAADIEKAILDGRVR